MKNSKRYQLECERHLNCIQDHKVIVNIRAAFTADISHVQCKLNFITFHVSALIFYVVTTDLGCLLLLVALHLATSTLVYKLSKQHGSFRRRK